ncbi:acyltransferase family protein [Bacillus massiliglaciei]|uniref:acyltransferase family protein n=1 Tax=Bacillus massiliglaciei TaxID=1816693 RepID=UPI000A6CA32B|nr:acyltransferase family protein [Bacillus massiliglaciei]
MNQRDYFFDNAKFILIGFVVFGHLLNTYIHDNEVIYSLYKTIYSFHMPAFILVSGFFAKGFYQKGYLLKITKKLIIPYLIFQMIYTVYYYFLYHHSTMKVDILNPHWSLWFLISLFCWNIMLLAFAKLKPLTGILLSVSMALAVGYIDWISNYLSLSRTFVFFPMFLIGYHLSKESLCRLVTPSFKAASVIILGVVFIGFYLFPDINYKWLLGSKPYAILEDATFISMFKRLGFYMLSLVTVMSFLALVPRGKYFFTNWGKQTLYVYLLHGFFIRFFRESDIQNLFSSVESFLILAGISLLITIVLSSSIIASIAQPIIELKWTKAKQCMTSLKRKEQQESPNA